MPGPRLPQLRLPVNESTLPRLFIAYDIGNLYERMDFSPYGIFFVAGWRYIQWRGFVIVASVSAWLVFALEVALRRADRDRDLVWLKAAVGKCRSSHRLVRAPSSALPGRRTYKTQIR